MNRIAGFLTGAWPEGEGGVDQDINDTNWLIAEAERRRLEAEELARIQAQLRAEDLYSPPIDGPGWYEEPPASWEAAVKSAREAIQRAKDALLNAPAGVLAIGGGAILALGMAGEHGGLRFLRWIGAGTLAASALIAIRRAASGVE